MDTNTDGNEPLETENEDFVGRGLIVGGKVLKILGGWAQSDFFSFQTFFVKT